MIAFICIAVIGLALLLLGTFFDGLHDSLFDAADTSLSTAVVGATFGVTGNVGILALHYNLPWWAAITIAVVVGCAAGRFAEALVEGLVATESGSAVFDMVGVEGVVTAATNEHSGEVRLDDAREVESRLATSSQPLTPGTRIRVTAQTGSRVRVEPL